MNENEKRVTEKDMQDLISHLPEGGGIKFSNYGEELRVTSVTTADLEKLAENPKLFHVVTMLERPGAAYYFNFLEYNYFPPATSLNEEFEYRIFNWNGLRWGIGTFPIEKKQVAYETAEKTDMRLADGVPILIGPNGNNTFPLSSDRVFCLENAAGSSLYQEGGRQDIQIEENLKIEKLWAEHARKYL